MNTSKIVKVAIAVAIALTVALAGFAAPNTVWGCGTSPSYGTCCGC